MSAKKNIVKILEEMGINTYSPGWTDEDREKIPFIQSLSDRELAKCLLENDPRVGADGNHPSPCIWAFLKHNRPLAVSEYQRQFYNR